MDITVQLLRKGPQPVRGQPFRYEWLTFPTVEPRAALRIGHNTPPVGRITRSWWDGDKLMATAAIVPGHEAEVREQLADFGRGASLEFHKDGWDSELVPDSGPDGRSVMRLRSTRIVGLSLEASPARDDTMVVHVPEAPRALVSAGASTRSVPVTGAPGIEYVTFPARIRVAGAMEYATFPGGLEYS